MSTAFVEDLTAWVHGKHLEGDLAGTANVLGVSVPPVQDDMTRHYQKGQQA